MPASRIPDRGAAHGSPVATPEAPITWKIVSAALACAALSACGGGGSSLQSAASLAPPPPPPPPPPTNFDTAEFRRSDGPSFHSADAAWRDGATGMDQIIAIIDSGIDSDSPEFAGRIHPDSHDLAGNRGIDPENDHGTNVALIAAGARDDQGTLGIAFDAQLLALRADMPGTCGADTPQDVSLGCAFHDSVIAQGIDQAIASEASVINLSLGGSEADQQVLDAIRRASDAGIVIVVAAGNAGDGSQPGIDPDRPNPFAASLLAAGNGNIIIVGSVDENGNFSDFSNQAGDLAGSFISARGERLCCVHENGEIFVETIDGQQFVTLFSGTSFAAPQVAGAVALLAQAFPNLTAQEIAEILLESARDVGAAGPDSVFGSGILDIASAFQPKGTTTLAGTDISIGLKDDFAVGSAAMGDAFSQSTIGTVFTDRYDRAYSLDLSRHLRSSAQLERLRRAVGVRGYSVAASSDAFSFAITREDGARAVGLGWSQQLQLAPAEEGTARVLAARLAAQLGQNTRLGIGVEQSARGIADQLQARRQPQFLIAPMASNEIGFVSRSDFGVALRHDVGPWGVTVYAEQGQAWLGENRRASDVLFGVRERRDITQFSFAADRDWGAFDAQLSLTLLAEDQTLLGAYFNPSFGVDGADTLFLDGRIGQRIGRYWRLGAAIRAGLTEPRANDLIGSGSRIQSRGWSMDVERRSVFQPEDRVGLRISQPLRVSGGSVHFNLPVAYDYATETAQFGRQSLSLSPEGREVITEVNWTGEIWGADVSTSVYYRSQPGHFEDAPSDLGAIIRVGSSF